MKQNNKKQLLLFALPVLAAIIFGSLGATSAFAEDANISLVPDNVSSDRTDALLDVSVELPDRQAEVEFRGGTDGWAIIGGQAYAPEIGITGNTVRQDGMVHVQLVVPIVDV